MSIQSRRSEDVTGFVVRIPTELHAKIKAAAAAHGRSMNTEVVMRLDGEAPIDKRATPSASRHNPKRDEIALSAMVAIIGQPNLEGASPSIVADRAYQYADAMIEAARKGKEIA